MRIYVNREDRDSSRAAVVSKLETFLSPDIAGFFWKRHKDMLFLSIWYDIPHRDSFPTTQNIQVEGGRFLEKLKHAINDYCKITAGCFILYTSKLNHGTNETNSRLNIYLHAHTHRLVNV